MPLSGEVTRFAPSPTGYLHLGHALAALVAHEAATASGGRFLLRIEDIDQGRARPEFEAAILEDLAWLGLSWGAPPRRQSDHMAEYAAALARLVTRGLCYRCFRTRKEVAEASLAAPHGPEPIFFGGPLSADEEAARLARGEKFAWRLDSRAAADALSGQTLTFEEIGPAHAGRHPVAPTLAGDVVLARKDAPTSYHLACTHDDALAGVTLVTRGEDLFGATHVQRTLQALFGWPAPRYLHHRLVLGPDGVRLAKRDEAQTLRALRAQGLTPDDVRASI